MFKRFLLVCAPLLFFSCNQNETGQAIFPGTLPESNGGRLDVIVVAEESLWQDKAGEVFRKYFTQSQQGLPQSESILNVRQVTPKQFNNLLQRARNIVVLEKGPGQFSVTEDRYAKPQVFITFSAPDQDALADLIRKHQEKLILDLHESEMLLLQKRVTAKSQPVPKTLKQHNVTMKIPPAFELEVAEKDLLVFWNKTLKTQQGLFIHFEPLDDSEIAMGDRIVPLRDSITKLYVPGDKEGSYMQVEDYIPPVFTNITIEGNYAIETRGLWRTEGDFMGGAFISYTIFDETHRQRITLDAFLYAPEVNKRNHVLELEAILRTIEITN